MAILVTTLLILDRKANQRELGNGATVFTLCRSRQRYTKLLTNVLQPINRRQFRSRRAYWFARFSLVFILALGFTGCQSRDEAIAGIEIPIPPEMKKLPDKMFKPIPGFDDGQATFEGKATPGEIFTFYQENMEARGWKPTTFMSGEKNQLAYSKDNRVCLVWYTPNDNGITSLTIMIGTLRPSA